LAIDDSAIRGVHLTRLTPDGRKKIDGNAKIMLGSSTGWPICLAPASDLGGLLVTEGIEDALSGHAVSGLGAWAAGSASRLPTLADAVPDFIECISIAVDPDSAGQKFSNQLARRLVARNIEVRLWE
jgi:hypothetical protein